MENAAIVFANYYQFKPGDYVVRDLEKSRMLLCCRTGTGQVWVNGQHYTLNPGAYLFLPWDHAITYQADPNDPFFVTGVHIVPDYDPDKPFEAKLYSLPTWPQSDYPWRKDISLGVLDGIITGHSMLNPALDPLVDYIVQTMYCREPQEWLCRRLAPILINELSQAHIIERLQPHDLPVELQRVMQYIADNLSRKLRVEEIASVACVSASTLHRMFKRYLRRSIIDYIQERRLREAQRLLSSTPLLINQIGHLVGFDDPFYFSKVFTRFWGMCPSTYRRTKGIM